MTPLVFGRYQNIWRPSIRTAGSRIHSTSFDPLRQLPRRTGLLVPSYDSGCCLFSSQASSWADLIASRMSKSGDGEKGFERPSWSQEWKRLGLGAELFDEGKGFPENLFFVQLGFGVDQHGDRLRDGFATKAAVRAVRNAIEFNSIPGVIDHIPGGRKEMLIHVKLGVPPPMDRSNDVEAAVNVFEVAKVFPYGKLLPIEIVSGGLEFHSGRVVEELGDDDDVGVCCVACVSIGYNNDARKTINPESGTVHKTYSTKDGY